MYHIFLIHFSVEGHLGCFQVLAMTNKAAMNIVEHMSLWHDWASFGYIPKSGITGSWGRLFPNFLRNCHTDIQRGFTTLHSHQQCRSVPFTPLPLQHKLSSVFCILAILTSVRWNLRVVFIWISLMTKDVEHFLKCLSVILDSSAESSPFRSILHFFFIGLCVLLVFNFLNSLYILEMRPLSDVGLVKIFPNL